MLPPHWPAHCFVDVPRHSVHGRGSVGSSFLCPEQRASKKVSVAAAVPALRTPQESVRMSVSASEHRVVPRLPCGHGRHSAALLHRWLPEGD